MNKKILTIMIAGLVSTASAEYLLKQAVKSGIAESFVVEETHLYSFSSHTFTNCNRVGNLGPSLADCTSHYSTSWDEDTNNFSMPHQGYQLWTIPDDGDYEIEVAGARGGAASGADSNSQIRGAIIKGTFSFTKGEQLLMVVGQKGGDNTYAGGGGGSFVTKGNNKSSSEPLIIAGGGGGMDRSYMDNDSLASYTENGKNTPYSGGTNGQGGYGTGYRGGAGGFFTNGGGNAPYIGYSFRHGANGGDASYGDGGFGGGSTQGNDNGGAGGGYSGGATGYENNNGGGGGSFNSGSSPVNVGYNNGHGYIKITKL